MDNIYHFPKSYFFTDREWFLANVTGYDTLLLHLSEGTVAFVAGINLCTGVNLGAFKNDPTITHTPPLRPPPEAEKPLVTLTHAARCLLLGLVKPL